jgi:alanine racemase
MTETQPRRHCEAQIDLDAIRSNYEQACRLAPDSRAIAVIKANAYGHGAVAVARALADRTPAFAVGLLEEALELRAAGITEPLLLLEGVNSVGALEAAVEHALTVVVHNEPQLEDLERATLARPVAAWLKIDTGMHRLGLPPAMAGQALARLRASGNCREPVVVCTHLASADEPGSAFVHEQLRLFDGCIAGLDAPQSIANSGAILAFPDSRRHWNRPGYMLYGCSPFEQDLPAARDLVPAMTLSAEIIGLREVPVGETVGYRRTWTAARASRIATVAIGYADGYPRHAPTGTPTLVRGQVAPLVGTVSMDMLSIDVTDADAAIGDPVVLWGPGLPVDVVARAAGTIGYQLLTQLSGRVPRRYTGGESGQERTEAGSEG